MLFSAFGGGTPPKIIIVMCMMLNCLTAVMRVILLL